MSICADYRYTLKIILEYHTVTITIHYDCML